MSTEQISVANDYDQRPTALPAVQFVGGTPRGAVLHIVDRTSDQLNPRGAENTTAHCWREVTVTDEQYDPAHATDGRPDGRRYCQRCAFGAYASARIHGNRARRYRVVERPAVVVLHVIDTESGETVQKFTESPNGRKLAEQVASELNERT